MPCMLPNCQIQTAAERRSVVGNGTWSDTIQAWKYGNKSGLHGLESRSSAAILFSAGLSGDVIWTHVVATMGR
jgi:hypothetical protein